MCIRCGDCFCDGFGVYEISSLCSFIEYTHESNEYVYIT